MGLNKHLLLLLYNNTKFIEAREIELNKAELSKVLKNILVANDKYLYSQFQVPLERISKEDFSKWVDKKLDILYNSSYDKSPICIGYYNQYHYVVYEVIDDTEKAPTRYGIWQGDVEREELKNDYQVFSKRIWN